MASLSSLPSETVEEILLNCHPSCAAALSQTCRTFRNLVYFSPDSHLWRNLYLAQPFDDPRNCISRLGYPRGEVDWKAELQAAVRAETVLANPSICRPGEARTISQTLLWMVHHTPPWGPAYGGADEVSENLLWVTAQLQVSGAVFLGGSPGGEDEQLKKRLHTYFGLTPHDLQPATRAASRAYVYSMARYREDNLYGPFMPGQGETVNWPHLKAIHHVVSMHIVPQEEVTEQEYFIYPLSMPFLQSMVDPGVNLNEITDWAGVEGNWYCSFCFCDHRDLLEFNTQQQEAPGSADTTIFEDPNFREVFRTLEFKLSITNTVPDDLHPNRPTIHFAGHLGVPASATMTGWVRMTPEDEIRWHFVSGEPGNQIWSSEGIQIGGVRSKYGVLGTWTTIFHDDDDPVGPFWLRRTLEK